MYGGFSTAMVKIMRIINAGQLHDHPLSRIHMCNEMVMYVGSITKGSLVSLMSKVCGNLVGLYCI